MTVTSPANRLRARLRLLARGAAVAISLGLGASGAAPALAADEGAVDDAAIDAFVSIGVRGTVTPEASTTARFTLRNDGESELSSGTAVVELSRTALTDPAALSAWLDEGVLEGDFARIGGSATLPVRPDSSTTTTITIPQEAIAGLAPGVYPLRAQLSGAEADGVDDAATGVVTTSVLLVPASAAPPVTVLVPITSTPESGGLLTADELTALTAPDGALTAQLDGVAGTSAVLAVDPAIPAAIRVLGTAAPTTATEWLQRLEDLPNERFSLLFADADAATQAHAGLPTLLTSGPLGSFLDPANFPTAPGTPGPTPTPTATATPSLPDDAELASVPGAISGILWPREDVAAADLATLAGYLGGSATTVLPSTSVSGSSGGHAVHGEHQLMITAAAASEALSGAAAEPDADARDQLLAAARAHLALSSPNAETPTLIGLERNEARTSDALRAAIAAVDSPGASLTSLQAAPAAPVTLTAQPDLTRADALHALLDDETALTAFASILDDPSLLLTPERIRILRTIDVATSSRAFPDAVATHQEQTRETLDAVGIEPSSTIRLFGANADFAFWVRNELPWPVNVRLDALPTDTRLDIQRTTDAVASASSNTRIRIPVSARIGSGELDVRLKLYSPTGVEIGSTQYANVSVRADWEPIGLGLFGGLAVLLITLGVVRTILRKRREASEASGASGDESTHVDDEADAVTAAPEEDQ